MSCQSLGTFQGDASLGTSQGSIRSALFPRLGTPQGWALSTAMQGSALLKARHFPRRGKLRRFLKFVTFQVSAHTFRSLGTFQGSAMQASALLKARQAFPKVQHFPRLGTSQGSALSKAHSALSVRLALSKAALPKARHFPRLGTFQGSAPSKTHSVLSIRSAFAKAGHFPRLGSFQCDARLGTSQGSALSKALHFPLLGTSQGKTICHHV
jgi:hypothetical protein